MEITEEQYALAKLLTVIVRQDRFVEGTFQEVYQSGLLTRILHRAAVLSNEADETCV
jgi:hypothetical protein